MTQTLLTVVGFRLDRGRSVGYRKFVLTEDMSNLQTTCEKVLSKLLTRMIREDGARVISIRIVEEAEPHG